MSKAYQIGMWLLGFLCVGYVLVQGTGFDQPYIYISAGFFAAALGTSFGSEFQKRSDETENGLSSILLLPFVAFVTYTTALLAIGIPTKLISEVTGIGG
jgi:hypothetical protein